MSGDNIIRNTYTNELTECQVTVSIWDEYLKNESPTVILSTDEDILEISYQDVPGLILLLTKCI